MTTSPQSPSARKVPFGTLWRYGAGQIGAQVFRDTPAALLPVFMTTLLGIPPWMAGLAVIVPKLWVIICDPLVGALSDRFKLRFGRTPFLIVGAIATNLGFIAIFSLHGIHNPILAAAAVSLVFLLASTAFSAFSVPYLALASEVSDDPYQRSRLLAARMMGAIVGVIAGIGLAQPLVGRFGGGAAGWFQMSLVLAGFCALTMLVTAFTMHRRAERSAAGTQDEGLFIHIAHALRERDFRWLTLTYLLQCVGQACGYAVLGFIFLYCVGDVSLILPFVLLMTIGSVSSQPIWLALAKRWGAGTCFILCNIGWAALSVTNITIHPGQDVLMTMPGIGPVSTQQAIVLFRGIPLAFFNCGFLLFILSMLTDTIGRVRARSGGRVVNEGVFSGIFSATEKLSFAIAPLIAGVVMSLTGFRASTDGAHPQSGEAITGILALYSVIPAAMILLSCVTFHFYIKAMRNDPEPEAHPALMTA